MQSYQRIFFFSLFCLVLFIQVSSTQAFDPRPKGGQYSEIDWTVYVQLLYGSIDGNAVFIPQQVTNLPRPELWIVMGGMERGGNRTVNLTTYSKNDTIGDSKNYTLTMGDGGDPHYAQRKIDFPATNKPMRVVFTYLDIIIEFEYAPLAIYFDIETTQAEVQTMVVIYVLVTAIVIGISEYAARRLQRHVVVVPGLPVMSILAFSASFITTIFLLTYISYPFGFFEKTIIFLLSIQPWLLQLPIFFLFTLWLSHRHSPEKLRIVQMDYSKFYKEGDKVKWIKDMNCKLRAYEKKDQWYICNPDSWREFFWRIFNFRIKMINHEPSIKPDKGIWNENSARLYIAMTDLEVEGRGLFPQTNFSMKGVLQTLGIVAIGGICVLLGGLGNLGDWGNVLAVIGVGIVLIGVFGKGAILELKYQPHRWVFDPIEFLEAEMILTQHVEFMSMQKKIRVLEADYRNTIANFHEDVALRVRLIAKRINRTLALLPSEMKKKITTMIEQEKPKEEKKKETAEGEKPG